MSLFYAAGMCLNDFCDREPDRIKKPSRPIPSGRVTPREAFALTVVLFAAALSLLLLVPYTSALLGGIALMSVIIAYDFIHGASAASVLLMGTCRLMIFLIVSLSLANSLVPAALAGGCLQFCYVVAISVVARLEKNRKWSFPVVPVMIGGISLLDGIMMALVSSPWWLFPGLAGMIATLQAQKFVRGD
jgi:4-hydroxybenzoate polyprenyltransferase